MTNDMRHKGAHDDNRQCVLKVIKMIHIVGQLSKRFCFRFDDSFSSTTTTRWRWRNDEETTAVRISKTSLIHMGTAAATFYSWTHRLVYKACTEWQMSWVSVYWKRHISRTNASLQPYAVNTCRTDTHRKQPSNEPKLVDRAQIIFFFFFLITYQYSIWRLLCSRCCELVWKTIKTNACTAQNVSSKGIS